MSLAAAAIFTAAKKSGRAWIGGRLVWCAWHDGAIVLVTGGPEQDVPLSDEVTLVDSSGAAALELRVTAFALAPGTAEWDAAASLLAERRLNGDGKPSELIERWRGESTITRLEVLDAELQ